jgi:uncharacterized protein
MGKLLLWVIVIGVCWAGWALVRNWQRKTEERVGAPPRPAGTPSRPAEAEQIVSCGHCGLHLPASEAIEGPGGPFCCVEHRDAARR